MSDGWIPDEEWEHIQHVLPIVCVDVLAVRHAAPTDRLAEVGLIWRHTPDRGPRWCLIGGRVRYGESIHAAVTRHVRDTLGDEVQFDVSRWREPLFVAQYAPTAREGFLHDPRKHAVALTYALDVVGAPAPQNEALDFRWFPVDQLPPSGDFGFGQDRVVAACMDRLQART